MMTHLGPGGPHSARTERGDEVPSKDEADIFAFTEADVDKGWTGLRPGDVVAFVPSPTATLGKNTPKVRRVIHAAKAMAAHLPSRA